MESTKANDSGLLVSVIIPVYNVEAYLRESLNSVINQTYGNLEIIIIEDGSTDNSARICDEYRWDDRVLVIHQKNHGLSAARNVGLDRMKGKYVAFLDPDDVYHPYYIQDMLATLEREKADLVICRYKIYKNGDHISLANAKVKMEPSARPGKYNRCDALRSLIDGEINVSVWNKLYDRKLWNNIRFPAGQNYEDIVASYLVLTCANPYI